MQMLHFFVNMNPQKHVSFVETRYENSYDSTYILKIERNILYLCRRVKD